MARYTVIEEFSDIQDGSRVYHAGDVYPRCGYIPTADRVNTLASSNNKLGRAVIKAVEEPRAVVVEPVVAETTETAETAVSPSKKRTRRSTKK